MATTYQTLHFELDEVLVEKLKVWGKENIKTTVEEIKRVYNLSKGDNYSFFIVAQSRMNKTNILLDKARSKKKSAIQ